MRHAAMEAEERPRQAPRRQGNCYTAMGVVSIDEYCCWATLQSLNAGSGCSWFSGYDGRGCQQQTGGRSGDTSMFMGSIAKRYTW